MKDKTKKINIRQRLIKQLEEPNEEREKARVYISLLLFSGKIDIDGAIRMALMLGEKNYKP